MLKQSKTPALSPGFCFLARCLCCPVTFAARSARGVRCPRWGMQRTSGCPGCCGAGDRAVSEHGSPRRGTVVARFVASGWNLERMAASRVVARMGRSPNMLEWTSGDLFADKSLDAVCHGCNCAGAMGKGIALAFRARYPQMYVAYRALCSNGEFALGDVFRWDGEGMPVFNLATQNHWRSRASLEAIRSAVRRMDEICQSSAIARVGVPRIGAGLGGLAWDDVRAVLESELAASPTRFVVFERYERAGERAVLRVAKPVRGSAM